jgi:hypothetical protein
VPASAPALPLEPLLPPLAPVPAVPALPAGPPLPPLPPLPLAPPAPALPLAPPRAPDPPEPPAPAALKPGGSESSPQACRRIATAADHLRIRIISLRLESPAILTDFVRLRSQCLRRAGSPAARAGRKPTNTHSAAGRARRLGARAARSEASTASRATPHTSWGSTTGQAGEQEGPCNGPQGSEGSGSVKHASIAPPARKARRPCERSSGTCTAVATLGGSRPPHRVAAGNEPRLRSVGTLQARESAATRKRDLAMPGLRLNGRSRSVARWTSGRWGGGLDGFRQ